MSHEPWATPPGLPAASWRRRCTSIGRSSNRSPRCDARSAWRCRCSSDQRSTRRRLPRCSVQSERTESASARSRLAIAAARPRCCMRPRAWASRSGSDRSPDIPAFTLMAAAVWGFGAGLLVALGPASSFVGLQSAVAAIVAGGFPANGRDALLRGVIVSAGGLLQILLVVIVWPLKRFPTERRALGAIYRSLAAYAAESAWRRALRRQSRARSPKRHPGFSDPQAVCVSQRRPRLPRVPRRSRAHSTSLAALAAQHMRVSDRNLPPRETRRQRLRRTWRRSCVKLPRAWNRGAIQKNPETCGPRSRRTPACSAIRPSASIRCSVSCGRHGAWRDCSSRRNRCRPLNRRACVHCFVCRRSATA